MSEGQPKGRGGKRAGAGRKPKHGSAGVPVSAIVAEAVADWLTAEAASKGVSRSTLIDQILSSAYKRRRKNPGHPPAARPRRNRRAKPPTPPEA